MQICCNMYKVVVASDNFVVKKVREKPPPGLTMI
jgi:hypothetical protein